MKKGRSRNEEGKKQESSLFLMKQNMLNNLKYIGETSYETSIQSFGSG